MRTIKLLLGVFSFASNYCVMFSEGSCSLNSTGTEELVANKTKKLLPLSIMYQIPLQYQNMSCVWNISAPFGSLVRISLQHLYPYSENKQNCPTDNIAIYDGHSKLSNLVLQMCFSHDSWASFKTSVLYSTGSSLVISLRTSQSFRIRPVLIWYEGIWPTPVLSNACNSSEYAAIEIQQDETVMSIANLNNTSETVCKWNITAPKFHQVKLWFSKISGTCENIKVLDQSKLSSAVNRMPNCSSDNPVIIFSNEQNLLVEFKMNRNLSAVLAYFIAVKIPPFSFSCSRKKEKWTLQNSHGVLASYDYPHQYPTSSHCSWAIKVPQYQIVKLTFKAFSLQYSENCAKDYLKVASSEYDLGSLGTFCGNSVPHPVYSSTNEMYLKFRSDFTITAMGFEAIYEAVNDSSWGDCSRSGTQLKGRHGTFFTPRYPRPFPSQVGCLWQITAPPAHHVRLSFSHLNLGSCSSFSLTISEGKEANGTHIGSYCGLLDLPQRITYSNGHQLWVHFKSNSQSTNYRRGFYADYEVVRWLPVSTACSSNGKLKYLEEASGVIASEGFPNNYSNNVDCGFAIWISKAESVTLTFNSFHLEPSHNCSSDYVEVFDGLGSTSPSLGRFCSRILPPPVTTTQFGYMFVKFVSNGAGQYPGFKASYKASYAMEPGILALIILTSLVGAIVIFVVVFVLLRRTRSKHHSDGYRSAAVTVPSDETNL